MHYIRKHTHHQQIHHVAGHGGEQGQAVMWRPLASRASPAHMRPELEPETGQRHGKVRGTQPTAEPERRFIIAFQTWFRATLNSCF